MADTARRVRPYLTPYIPVGKPAEPSPIAQGTYTVDNSKSIEQLDIQYKSFEEMIGDALDSIVPLTSPGS